MMNRRVRATPFGLLLVVIVSWGALAFGAVYPWAYWPLAAAAAGGGLWALISTRAWEDPRLRHLGMALGVTGLAIGAQLVALPYALLRQVSPGVDRFLRQSTVAYHPASLHPLSIAPDATAVALGLFVAFALLWLGTQRMLRTTSLEWLISQFMGLGAALAVLGVVQQAFLDKDAPLVYGFWQPSYGAAPFGPFINRNHFAGWMVMVLPMVAAYAYVLFLRAERPHAPGVGGWLRWLATVEANRFVLVTVVGLAMAVSVVLTGSRSGIASLALALVVLGASMRHSLARGRTRTMAWAYLTLIVVGALAWGGVDTLAARFANAPTELEGRFSAWRDSATMLHDFPWSGTGIGTFADAMLVYQTADRASMYAQAHNDYVQLAAEGGLLVGIPAAAVLVLVVTGVRRRLRAGQDDPLTYWIRRGAVAGLAGMAVQSIVEFSLQMPGNTACFVVLLALALHRPSRLAHAYRV